MILIIEKKVKQLIKKLGLTSSTKENVKQKQKLTDVDVEIEKKCNAEKEPYTCKNGPEIMTSGEKKNWYSNNCTYTLGTPWQGKPILDYENQLFGAPSKTYCKSINMVKKHPNFDPVEFKCNNLPKKECNEDNECSYKYDVRSSNYCRSKKLVGEKAAKPTTVAELNKLSNYNLEQEFAKYKKTEKAPAGNYSPVSCTKNSDCTFPNGVKAGFCEYNLCTKFKNGKCKDNNQCRTGTCKQVPGYDYKKCKCNSDNDCNNASCKNNFCE